MSMDILKGGFKVKKAGICQLPDKSIVITTNSIMESFYWSYDGKDIDGAIAFLRENADIIINPEGQIESNKLF